MALKRGTVLTRLLILLVVAGGVVAWYLPVYVERQVLPRVFQTAGVREYTIAVRRIGFSGLDLGQITLGDAKEPWLSIDNIQVDYSLSGIVAREIDSIVVNGLQLEAAVQDGRLIFPGLKIDRRPDSRTVSGHPLQLPVTVDRMLVRNAVFAIAYNGQRFSVPFSLQVRRMEDASANGPLTLYECLGQFRPRGQEIRFTAKAALTGNRVDITGAADSLHLDVFSDLITAVAPLSVGGRAAVHGAASFMLMPLQLITVEGDCKLYGAKIIGGNISLRNRIDDDQKEIPLQLQINGDQEKVRIAVTGLVAETPFPVLIPLVESSISYSAAAVDLKGDFKLELVGGGLFPETTEKPRSPVRATADFIGHYSPATHDWRLTIPTTENRPHRAAQAFGYRLASVAAAYDQAVFSLAAEGSGTSGRFDYILKLAGLSVSSETVAVKVPAVSLTGHTVLGNGAGIETRFVGDFSGVHMTAGSASLQGDVSVAAGMPSPAEPPTAAVDGVSLQGRIKLNNFSAQEKGLGIQAAAIHGEIPFQWPPPSSGGRGGLIIPTIRWQQEDLGSLTAAIKQQGMGFVFQGVHENRLIKGLSLNFTGQATLAAPEAIAIAGAFNTVSATDQVEADLGLLHPDLHGFSLRGRMQLEGEGSLDRGIVRTRLNSRLQDATFWAADPALRIEGINTALSFADLQEMRSNPQQQLHFARASFGDFKVEDGEIDFQLESIQSLLVEKSAFKWAGGSIYTQALRIHPGVDKYNLTLFCDRLKLADLLEQFGAADAEGGGAVSGRIPLLYADGKLFFGDGFLYSTPGEGGTIRIAGADALAAGIPKNSPQFAQIDFAMEALKSFSYKWVKLHTTTEEENLVLTMQLDGMPDHPLPFRYDSKLGEFSRIDLQTEKGIQQPIRLDVNFRLPLNSILDYSKGIGKLIDRMK